MSYNDLIKKVKNKKEKLDVLNMPLELPKLFRTTHRFCQYCFKSMPSYADYEKCNYCHRISGKYKISDCLFKENRD